MERFILQSLSTPLIVAGLMTAISVGCNDGGDPREPDQTDLPAKKPLGGPQQCPPEACGFNGPKLADAIFGELDKDGEPNLRGLSIVDIVDPKGRALVLDIEDDKLIGLDPRTDEVVLGAAETAGARIRLEKDEGERAPSEWVLFIDGIGDEEFFSNQPGGVPSYRISYAPAEDPSARQPLCPEYGGAMIVAGERYDERTLAITPDGEDRFFRFACADDMLGKSKRMSYDPGASKGHPYATTVAQRRATLAMLGADYCGTGKRFTEPGVALYWKNRADWMVVGARPDDTGRLEAGWSEYGVTCLDSPRLADRERAEIEAACGRAIPKCTTQILEASEWITWAP